MYFYLPDKSKSKVEVADWNLSISIFKKCINFVPFKFLNQISVKFYIESSR